MKTPFRTWTFTQFVLIVASVILIGIGCEKRNKVRKPETDTAKVDTSSWIIEHSEIK